MTLYGRGRIDWDADANGWRVYPSPDVAASWDAYAGGTFVPDVDTDAPGMVDAAGILTEAGDTYARALAALGLKRPHRASPVLAMLRDGWDAGDVVGSAWLALVTVSGVVSLDLDADPAPLDDDHGDAATLARAYAAGLITADDLDRAYRILSRLIDMTEATS